VVEQGAAGRLGHVGASAELVTVANDIVQVVKVMNGMVRIKFANQPYALAAWESASSVFATPKPEKPEDDGTSAPGSGGTSGSGGDTSPRGEVRPAA
jgi:hypothetical protein